MRRSVDSEVFVKYEEIFGGEEWEQYRVFVMGSIVREVPGDKFLLINQNYTLKLQVTGLCTLLRLLVYIYYFYNSFGYISRTRYKVAREMYRNLWDENKLYVSPKQMQIKHNWLKKSSKKGSLNCVKFVKLSNWYHRPEYIKYPI